MTKGGFIAAATALAGLIACTTAASALDRRVVVVNNTSYDIMEFYASNVGTEEWEEDILGKHKLPSGASVTINIDDGSGYCKYDFRAVFDDGDEAVKRGVNVCEIGTFTFND